MPETLCFSNTVNRGIKKNSHLRPYNIAFVKIQEQYFRLELFG